ncbi:MAG: tetratricopeptide repeat protein [Candidatus Eisenbacteria bacterium]|nr:tetratricopeptide repeat protein [Candidatus Eisenbacteria bacterium]
MISEDALGTRKRISKKDLKHDALLESASKTTKFIEDHLNKVLIGVLVVVVAIVAWSFISKSKRATALQANAALTNATQALNSGLYAQAQEQLKQLTVQYPGTRSAGAAVCYLGTIHFQEGRFEEALASFNEYLDRYGRDGVLGITALEGKAAVLEQQREFVQAAATYEELAGLSSDNPPAYARYTLDAIRVYRSEADWQAVASAAERLLEEHPDARLAGQARMALAEARTRLQA